MLPGQGQPAAGPVIPGRIPDAERAAIMQKRLRELTFCGYRVEAVDGARALVTVGQPVNHVLHAVLTLFMCGLWAPVWLLLVVLGGVKRKHIHVDYYGNLIGEDLPIGPRGGPPAA